LRGLAIEPASKAAHRRMEMQNCMIDSLVVVIERVDSQSMLKTFKGEFIN
jgi:hypothetical protein